MWSVVATTGFRPPDTRSSCQIFADEELIFWDSFWGVEVHRAMKRWCTRRELTRDT